MRLLLADDHTLFRDALCHYIERAEPESVLTVAADFHEAMNKLKLAPEQDLVLLDLRMPGMEGMGGFRVIRATFPFLRVALMSGVAEPQDVEAAMNLGAVAYFPKTLSGRALLKAIQLVLTGEKFIPIDRNTNNIMPSFYGTSSTARPMLGGDVEQRLADLQLTRRERDVLAHLASGASNKEIANHLGLQIVTVKLHVRGLCRKLNAKNRTQVALRARELGLAG